MENARVFLENGLESNVSGIFYIFNSKYYFIYTLGEVLDDDYVQLYVSQVCKEVKNTPNGPLDTGYMIGIEITDPNEWNTVQTSITKIVDDKKNKTESAEIKYLPINMLVNFKILSKNKFKLMKHLLEDDFNVVLENKALQEETKEVKENHNDDVIIDYRSKFFEEQEKNEVLTEEIKKLNEKITNIKNILG